MLWKNSKVKTEKLFLVIIRIINAQDVKFVSLKRSNKVKDKPELTFRPTLFKSKNV